MCGKRFEHVHVHMSLKQKQALDEENDRKKKAAEAAAHQSYIEAMEERNRSTPYESPESRFIKEALYDIRELAWKALSVACALFGKR